MNTTKSGVAVAGMGGRGRYLARAFNDDPRTRLVAVCDTNRQALETARATFGDGVSYFHDQSEMCAKADFQIGVVASWDPAHRENAVNFLKRGVHVYLEKPMAQTVEDCDAILRAWEETDKTLMVGLELRYNNEQEFLIRVQKRHDGKVDEYHPPRADGGHGGGDPRILDDFIARAIHGEHGCVGALDARNSAAIAIASAISSETHQPVEIAPFRPGRVRPGGEASPHLSESADRPGKPSRQG